MNPETLDLINDLARFTTALSCIAISAALFWLLRRRPDLSPRSWWLLLLLAALVLSVGLLSVLAAINFGAVWPAVESSVRLSASLFAITIAILLWLNLDSLRQMPTPGYAASEQRRLTLELATALQRYELALRGSKVAIFTQDSEQRYTSISKPLFGLPLERALGATDSDLLGEKGCTEIVRLKRVALERHETAKGEIEVEEAEGTHWYDLHVEPLRDIGGQTVGLTGAIVDITERKEHERHLRLLMRELTHRSKNLLAVIQAMARQTARHAGSIDEFVEQFSARLQALARSHDLLVQESWHGASLTDMVRSQLGHHIDRENAQVRLRGPDVMLKPEAAQNIGLALHELSTNAAKYGALSVPGGRVDIVWSRPDAETGGIELSWTERGGPPVQPPEGRGFGSLVIERNLSRALDGEVTLTFAPEGLSCRVHIPEQHILPPR